MHDIKWIKDNIELFDKAMERRVFQVFHQKLLIYINHTWYH